MNVDRAVGWFFLGVAALVGAFYLTWDGWLYEWRACGFAGPNQHFDLDLFDMRWTLGADGVGYQSTSNLHNLLYLCYWQLLCGAGGLVSGNRTLKQGAIALLPITVSSVASTVAPLQDHLYPLQWAYDTVHLSGTAVGAWLLAREAVDVRAGGPVIWGTWILFLASKLFCCQFPFWVYPRAFFGVNQINDMPFDFFALEYGIVVALLYGLAFATRAIQRRFEAPIWRATIPVGVYLGACLLLNLAGLIQLQDIDTRTCPPVVDQGDGAASSGASAGGPQVRNRQPAST